MTLKRTITLLMTLLSTSTLSASDVNNPFIWLEEVQGEKALSWVKEQKAISTTELEAHPEFKVLNEKNLEVYQSKKRIPSIFQRGEYYYNFWQDDVHIRGIYRRTSLDEYRKAEPKWETVIDFDALAKTEDENWVYKGMDCLYPDRNLCLINLSRDGADATVVREFDMRTLKFVDDGFVLPEAKSSVSWIDENSLFVGTDFGGDSLTTSGYPRIAKRWKRGTSLDKAEQVFEGKVDSVGSFTSRTFSKTGNIDITVDVPTFFTNIVHILQKDKWVKLDKPDSATLAGYFNQLVYIQLKEEWKVGTNVYPAGAVIYEHIDKVLVNKAHYKIFVKNTKTKIVSGISFTKSAILVNWLDDVKSVLERYSLNEDNTYKVEQIKLESNGRISVSNANENSDDFFVTYENFLQPDSLYHVNGTSLIIEKLKELPAFFDASPYDSKQYFATSKDGTKIPYFVVMPNDMKLNGKNPTLLYGYGGFEVSMRPSYSATIGMDWFAQGGVYVLANIRGGGEYGPAWHRAALKTNRHKAYEDFEAVTEDLITRKITSPKHLGIRGGSNGGLLMGAMLTRRPDLFNAVVCQVPLLDMLRFHKLLAGASWMGEFGNPENPDEAAYLKSYSPYHNVQKDTPYPRALFTTSTRDDRVHPGHARKMVAKMKALGHDVMYYENTEGGHGGAANQKQSAYLNALIYTYLIHQLK
ncbi:MAG: prolyl oligopeptidase [Polaribacter sp.]|jgi:prolyl oligopeptidase